MESSSTRTNRIEVIETTSRIFIHYYEDNKLFLDYEHYLFFDSMARKYRACMILRIKNEDDFPSTFQRICVNKRGIIKDVAIGNNQDGLVLHNCCLEKNHHLCLLMKSRFDYFYQKLDIEQIINKMVWGNLSEEQVEESEENTCEE